MKRIELAVGEELMIQLEGIKAPLEGVISEIAVKDAAGCRDQISLEVIIRFSPPRIFPKVELSVEYQPGTLRSST